MNGWKVGHVPTMYETPEASPAAEAAVAETVAAAPPVVQPGPWAADLEAVFEVLPEEHRAAAIAASDTYMREKVQPRITHLETETAPARELYKDLLADADTTLATVIDEVYGEETAAAFKALLDGGATPAEATAVVEAVAEGEEVPAWAKPLVEKHQAQTDAELREQQDAEYKEVLAELQTAHPDITDEDLTLIHPFMSAAGGDIERAYAGYTAYTEAFKARHGITPAEAAEAETAEPPPVLGSEGAAAAPPPIEKVYKTFDEAWDDFAAERRAQAPPPVI
jgi:hypothetical protein